MNLLFQNYAYLINILSKCIFPPKRSWQICIQLFFFLSSFLILAWHETTSPAVCIFKHHEIDQPGRKWWPHKLLLFKPNAVIQLMIISLDHRGEKHHPLHIMSGNIFQGCFTKSFCKATTPKLPFYRDPFQFPSTCLLHTGQNSHSPDNKPF